MKAKAREKILKAADELFGKAGFDATTTREIADLSGVNKALIHYHFKSKEALLGDLLDNYYKNLSGTLEKALKVEGSLRDRIMGTVDAYMDFLEKNRNFSRIVQREASGGKHMDRIRDHMVPLFEQGTRLIRDVYPAARSGELAAPQVLISFYGMIVGYFTYSGVLAHLLGTDPLSKKNLRLRKQHLLKMVGVVLDAVEA